MKKLNRLFSAFHVSSNEFGLSPTINPIRFVENVAVAEYRKPIIKKPLHDAQSPKGEKFSLELVLTADPVPSKLSTLQKLVRN